MLHLIFVFFVIMNVGKLFNSQQARYFLCKKSFFFSCLSNPEKAQKLITTPTHAAYTESNVSKTRPGITVRLADASAATAEGEERERERKLSFRTSSTVIW